LNKHNSSNAIREQVLHLLKVILKPNYFQYNNKFFQPENGIAMGSPISSIMAEIYLQFFEELYIKQWLESREIIYYKRYVDDILIIFDQNKTDGKTNMNNIDKHNTVCDTLLSITDTTNICSHITTDLIIHRCTIIDFLTQCNSRKHA